MKFLWMIERNMSGKKNTLANLADRLREAFRLILSN
jgi:hypothetical protein